MVVLQIYLHGGPPNGPPKLIIQDYCNLDVLFIILFE